MILLLSRWRSDAPDATHRRDLGLLPLDQSLMLLQELAGPRASNEVASKRLLTSIGGYPLALQLIGGYLSSQEEEIADYLHWFERSGLTAIDFGKHQDQSVKFLLQHTYDALTLQQRHLFLTLGLLAPAPFPLELVRDILERPEQEIRQALGALINVCLLRRPEQDYEVSHPLVHTFAKESLSSQEKHAPSPSPTTITAWQERFLNALDLHFLQRNPYDVPLLTLWLPHVLPWLSKEELTKDQSLQAAQVLNGAGFDAITQGKYEQAEPLFQRALAIFEQHLGPQHPTTATSLNNLAALYRLQGKYVEAEPLFQRALAIFEQQLGPQHPDTARSLNNLALLYQAQGKYEQAEPLFQRALAILTQQVGWEHPNTQQAMSNYHTLLVEIHTGGDVEALLTILRQENPDSDT